MRYERLKKLEDFSRAKYTRNKESLVQSPELSEDDDKKLDLIWKEVAQKNGYKNVDVTTPKIEKLVNGEDMSLERPATSTNDELSRGGLSSEGARKDPEFELERMRIENAYELLNKGLDNGAKAAYLAFATFGVTFLMNFAAYIAADKSFMNSQQILWGAGMLCVTLIVYFGFIFGYSIYMSADLKKKVLSIISRKKS